MIEHRRLQIDARKWLIGKMAPKKYGDKQAHEHAGPEGGPITLEALLMARLPKKEWTLASRHVSRLAGQSGCRHRGRAPPRRPSVRSLGLAAVIGLARARIGRESHTMSPRTRTCQNPRLRGPENASDVQRTFLEYADLSSRNNPFLARIVPSVRLHVRLLVAVHHAEKVCRNKQATSRFSRMGRSRPAYSRRHERKVRV